MVNQRKAGAILSYISLLVNALISFLYVPVLLNALSTSEYGVYELIGSIIGYLSVMDIGLSTTLTRFYVKSDITKNNKDLENLLATSAIIYLFLTILAVLIGAGILYCFDLIFVGSLKPDEIVLAKQMMILVIVNIAITLPGNWFVAIINANERFIFARSLSILKYVLQIFTIIIVLQHYQSAIYVLVIQVLYNFLAVIFYVIYCKKNLKSKAKLHSIDWKLVASLLSFTFFILLNMIFDQIFWKTGQFILGATVGATSVAIYGVSTRLIIAYMQLSTGVSSVFLPQLTKICAKTDDMTQVNFIFNKVGHIQAILVGAVIVGFALLGQKFIYLWAGSDFNKAYFVTLILMFSLFFALVQNLGIPILQAKNMMRFRALIYIVIAILDVIISIPVAMKYGVLGVAIVASVLLILGTGPIINVYYYKVVGIDVIQFFKSITPLCIPLFFAALITWFLSNFIFLEWTWRHLIINIILFIAALYSCLYIYGFNDYERNLLRIFKQVILNKFNIFK